MFIVRWPDQSEPTRGLNAHKNEGVEMFKIFPDNHVENNPYKVLFGQGNWTCSIAIFTGTHKGPMTGPNGETISPTNRKFQLDFCTVARWKHGQIDEENRFYDQGGLKTRFGLLSRRFPLPDRFRFVYICTYPRSNEIFQKSQFIS
jgi:hypothetical protein